MAVSKISTQQMILLCHSAGVFQLSSWEFIFSICFSSLNLTRIYFALTRLGHSVLVSPPVGYPTITIMRRSTRTKNRSLYPHILQQQIPSLHHKWSRFHLPHLLKPHYLLRQTCTMDKDCLWCTLTPWKGATLLLSSGITVTITISHQIEMTTIAETKLLRIAQSPWDC